LVQEQPQDLCRCSHQARRCGYPQQQRQDEEHGVLHQRRVVRLRQRRQKQRVRDLGLMGDGNAPFPSLFLNNKNMKTIFYPGLGETKKNYKSLSKHLIVADIDWNTGKATSSKNCDTVVSFSLGAVFSLDIALKRKLEKLILCSPTPFESLGKCKAKQVIFIIGENEKFLQNVFKPLCKKNVKMIIVPQGSHKINKSYEKIIIQNI